jgi:hypothetical protein
MANESRYYVPRPQLAKPQADTPPNRSADLAGNSPGNSAPVKDQDHGTGMGPDCPASVGTGRHRLTLDLPPDQHNQPRLAPSGTVRHALVRTLNPQVGGSSPSRRTPFPQVTALRCEFLKIVRDLAVRNSPHPRDPLELTDGSGSLSSLVFRSRSSTPRRGALPELSVRGS